MGVSLVKDELQGLELQNIVAAILYRSHACGATLMWFCIFEMCVVGFLFVGWGCWGSESGALSFCLF